MLLFGNEPVVGFRVYHVTSRRNADGSFGLWPKLSDLSSWKSIWPTPLSVRQTFNCIVRFIRAVTFHPRQRERSGKWWRWLNVIVVDSNMLEDGAAVRSMNTETTGTDFFFLTVQRRLNSTVFHSILILLVSFANGNEDITFFYQST